MCHYKRQQKNPQKTKETKEQRKKWRKLLITILEEVVKISGIIFESHHRGIKSLCLKIFWIHSQLQLFLFL